MKSKHLICKQKALALLGAFLFLLLSVPAVNAQEDQPITRQDDQPTTIAPACLDAMIGIVFDYAVLKDNLDPDKTSDLSDVKKNCECILKEFPKLSGCSDISNNKLVKVSTEKNGIITLTPVYNSTATKGGEDIASPEVMARIDNRTRPEAKPAADDRTNTEDQPGADEKVRMQDMANADDKTRPEVQAGTKDKTNPEDQRGADGKVRMEDMANADDKTRSEDQPRTKDRTGLEDMPRTKDRNSLEYGANVDAVAPNRSNAVATASFVKVHIEPLGGKTNCRIFSDNNKYIIHSAPKSDPKKSILPPSEVAVSNDGDLKAARWDFVLIDEENMKKGFYILTREKEPRALFRSGTQLDLKVFKHMDGKARALASWNFMVNGKDIDGNTRYMFRPQDSKSHALGVDERTGQLLMVPTSVRATFTASAQTRSASESSRRPAPKFPIYWKVECIF